MESETMPREPTRTIFITGAASGIGRTTALLFAERGWFVGGFDANAEGLKRLASDLGERSMVGELNVVDRAAFGRAAENFGAATGGRLDILFNNAGVGLAGGPFEKTKFEDVATAVHVNLLGVLAGIHACAELLKATPNSLCFSTCSASAIFGLPNIAVYSATKAAVRGLTESLSLEFGAHGVRVADALPGLVDTTLISRQIAESKHEGPFRVIAPSQVAEAVWAAYESDKLHWYVPADLKQLAIDAATDPEALRQAIATKTGAYAWMKS
jgi:NADP-dependent 3-hydroxy acid dehydrogenase YdfG